MALFFLIFVLLLMIALIVLFAFRPTVGPSGSLKIPRRNRCSSCSKAKAGFGSR